MVNAVVYLPSEEKKNTNSVIILKRSLTQSVLDIYPLSFKYLLNKKLISKKCFGARNAGLYYRLPNLQEMR